MSQVLLLTLLAVALPMAALAQGGGCSNPNACLNGGTCLPIDPLNNNCACPPYTSGFYCEILTNPCISNPCSNGTVCQVTFANMTYGYFCNPDLCANVLCPPGMYCTVISGSVACVPFVNPCASNPCLASQTCVPIPSPNPGNPIGGYQCVGDPCLGIVCPPGWQCQSTGTSPGSCVPVNPPPCDSHPCPAGWTCTNLPTTPATYTCNDPCSGITCPPNYGCQNGVCIPIAVVPEITPNKTESKEKCCGCSTNVYCGGGGGGSDGVAASATAALISTVSALQSSITTGQAQVAALQTAFNALQATAATQASVSAVAASVAALAARVDVLEHARQDQWLSRRRSVAAVDTNLVARFDVHEHGPALWPGSSTPAIVYNAVDDSFLLNHPGVYLLDASLEATVTSATAKVEFAWQEGLVGGGWNTLPGFGTVGGATAVIRPHSSGVVAVPIGATPFAVRVNALSATGFTRWTTGWARVLMLHSYD